MNTAEEYMDPRQLDREELLERTIKAERQNKKLARQIEKLQAEKKESMIQAGKMREDIDAARSDARRIMESAARSHKMQLDSDEIVYKITNALQPILAPEIEEATVRAERAEETLAEIRRVTSLEDV